MGITKQKAFSVLLGVLLLSVLVNCAQTHLMKEEVDVKQTYEVTPSLQALLTLIQAVEKAYPKDDWKITATRLRKTHYNSMLWNLVLLESQEIKPIAASSGVPVSYIERLQRGEAEFIDPKGNSVDMGHIWALVNALSQKELNKIVDGLTKLEVQDAISWSGDIGSAISAYALQGEDKKVSLVQNFHNLAGSSDLYGATDGFGVYLQDVDSSWPLSKRIEYFYTHNLDERFEYLAQGANLGLENKDGKLSVSELSINKVIFPQVKEFTLFWTLHVCKTNKLVCIAEEIEGKPYTKNNIKEAINLYLDWLEQAQK